MSNSNFKDLAKNLLIERDAGTLSPKCSTQVNLPENLSGPIIKLGQLVKNEHLHEYGRESEPHVTVLYGINPSKTALQETADAIRSCNVGTVNARIGDISKFSTAEFDVLKFEIISEDLSKLNNCLTSKVPYENDFPDYNPHMTIAYVKSGMGDYYIDKMKKSIGNRLTGKPINFKTVLFSDENHDKTPIKLGYPQSGPVEHPNTKSDINEDMGLGAGMPGGMGAGLSGQFGVYNSPNVRQNTNSFKNYKRYNMTSNNTVVSSGYYDTVFDEDIAKIMRILKKIGFKPEWPTNDYEEEFHMKNPRRADQTHTMSTSQANSPQITDPASEEEEDVIGDQSGINLSVDTIMRHLKAEFGDKLMTMHKEAESQITYDSILLGLKDVMGDLKFPDKDYAVLRVLKQLIKEPKYYDELGKYDIKENYVRDIYGTKFKPLEISKILKELQ